MTAYYNEIDPYAAEWLRNLIKEGHIAPGVVDERSIEDIKPDELVGYTQCHFFAGVGVWSLALRRAGWPDNRPIWTGSCPCQPFSAAGAGGGFADPRHLWPSFGWLIKQCAPPVVIGEQVASKDVEPWVDLVHADLEAMGYAFGAVPFPSAGIGAPHIRDRLYWVADTDCGAGRQRGPDFRGGADGGDAESRPGPCGGCMPDRLADSDGGHAGAEWQQCSGEQRQQPENGGCDQLALGRMANPASQGRRPERTDLDTADGNEAVCRGQEELGRCRPADCAGPVNGLWVNSDWLFCRDGKWRPVESGTFPLANGAPSRVGRLRAYGNAINAEAAKEFIAAYMQL